MISLLLPIAFSHFFAISTASWKLQLIWRIRKILVHFDCKVMWYMLHLGALAQKEAENCRVLVS